MFTISSASRLLQKSTLTTLSNLHKPKILPKYSNMFFIQQSSLFRQNSLFRFSTNPQENLNKSQEQTETIINTTATPQPEEVINKSETESTTTEDTATIEVPKINGLTTDEFISLLRQKDPSENPNLEYNSPVIYALTASLKTRPQISKKTYDNAFWMTTYVLQFAVWTPISYLFFTYVHPYSIVVPVVGMAFTLFASRNAQYMLERSILRMDLVNEKQIALYTWGKQGTGTICNIEGANIVMVAKPKTQDPAMTQNNEEKESITIEATFVEAISGKKVNAMFLVAPEDSAVENNELFRNILRGEAEEVEKFKYNGPESEETRTQ